MREREKILDIFEMCSGQRMMTTYIRPGGLWRDVPVEFEPAVREFVRIMPKRIDEYESLLTKNYLFLERTKGIGVISAEECLQWGITGPILRGAGLAYDLRKARPYCGYEHYEFDIPTLRRRRYLRPLPGAHGGNAPIAAHHPAGHGYPAVWPGAQQQPQIRAPAPLGNWRQHGSADPSLQVVDGRLYRRQPARVYAAIESPRGELGVFLESDGSPKPYRVHYRTPSFANLQIMPLLTRGHFVADVVGIIGSIDIVLGDADR